MVGEPSKARILIIDDEELSNQILADLLGEQFDVDIALNLDEAETFLSNDPPDLILLDAVLPGECGITYLKLIKTIPAFRSSSSPAAWTRKPKTRPFRPARRPTHQRPDVFPDPDGIPTSR